MSHSDKQPSSTNDDDPNNLSSANLRNTAATNDTTLTPTDEAVAVAEHDINTPTVDTASQTVNDASLHTNDDVNLNHATNNLNANNTNINADIDADSFKADTDSPTDINKNNGHTSDSQDTAVLSQAQVALKNSL